MADRYERTLWVSAPANRVWRAFTEPEDLRVWHGAAETFEARDGGRVRFADPGHPAVEGVVEQALPPRLLRWRITDDTSVVEERFDPADGGTRITVLHSNPDGWPVHELEAIRLGWEESLSDLVLLLEHGVRFTRHMTFKSSVGATLRSTSAGVEVVAVRPNTFAAAVGLQAGDLLVQLGQAPIFDRSDVALITREHGPSEVLEAVFVREGELLRQSAALSPRR
jgi:uncharacterized protein YndB with AHSA1/START domain